VTGFYIHGTELSSLELSSCHTSILLKMEALDFSETSGTAYPVMRYHVPKNGFPIYTGVKNWRFCKFHFFKSM